MSAGLQAMLFLIQVVFGLVTFVFILRFLMRATRVDWRLPLVHITARLTNWACAPLGRLLPVKGRWDWAALAAAWLTEVAYAVAVSLLTGQHYGAAGIALFGVAETLNVLLDSLFWLIIIQAILSWVQPGYNPNLALFHQLAEPVLAPFRRFIPSIAGLDLSPIAALIAIKLAQILLVGPIANMARAALVGG
ncbi:YggT family protein [Sulfurivirga sp.]|uniref:YggT family protein n=1 Tax=Sulfurivirga sp. TaxID=2614236 RepID=UPI0025D5FF10|nr:YggT family protein [Sulfurivirga sp.]